MPGPCVDRGQTTRHLGTPRRRHGPTNIVKIRRQFAEAACIRKTRGCATTASAITVGHHSDPSVSLRTELLSSWMQTLADTKVPMAALQKVWEKQRARLQDARRWSRVNGPMAAVIATICLLYTSDAADE